MRLKTRRDISMLRDQTHAVQKPTQHCWFILKLFFFFLNHIYTDLLPYLLEQFLRTI